MSVRLSTIATGVGALVIAILAGSAVFSFRDALRPLLVSDETAARSTLGGTKRDLVYGIPKDGTVRFAFSRPTQLVRILSQPNIMAESWATKDSWVYGYRVVLRDRGGAIVASHDVYSRALHPSRLRPYKRPDRFRRGTDVKVALQDEAVIETDAPVASAELTALDAEAGVKDIDARVYERLPFIGRSALSAFRRRTSDEQADLARADAFPPALLSDAERSSLMSNRWKIVGPVGIAGEDYRVDVVYERPFMPQRAGE